METCPWPISTLNSPTDRLYSLSPVNNLPPIQGCDLVCVQYLFCKVGKDCSCRIRRCSEAYERLNLFPGNMLLNLSYVSQICFIIPEPERQQNVSYVRIWVLFRCRGGNSLTLLSSSESLIVSLLLIDVVFPLNSSLFCHRQNLN